MSILKTIQAQPGRDGQNNDFNDFENLNPFA